jgi:hypothetical protein
MPSLPSPGEAVETLGRTARSFLRRALRVPPVAGGELRPVPDDLPRDGAFAQPLVVTATVLGEPEEVDGRARVTFRVLVRDANRKRCSDVHVEARVTGPERSAVGETTTDMLGAARFRMAGPPGDYRIEVLEVAALALDWDREQSTDTATVTVHAGS